MPGERQFDIGRPGNGSFSLQTADFIVR